MSSDAKPPLLPPSEQTRTRSPHRNDVLCGRGGTVNAHPGNEQYRTFVDRKKRIYLTARFKREKRLIAQSIVDEIRKLSPPGRFLMKENEGDYWFDIGDEKARDKTSQALRENALSVRKQIEEEFNETRRQQVREVAIAAGRDPDEAVKEMSNRMSEKEDTALIENGAPVVKADPYSDERDQKHEHTGFIGRSGYGPLYEAQQPKRAPHHDHLHQVHQGIPHPQYHLGHTIHHPHPYELCAHLPSHFQPQPSYYSQGQQHSVYAQSSYPYSQSHQQFSHLASDTSQHIFPHVTLDPHMHPTSHYTHQNMTTSRTATPLVETAGRHINPLMVLNTSHHNMPQSLMTPIDCGAAAPHLSNLQHHNEPSSDAHPAAFSQEQVMPPTLLLPTSHEYSSDVRHVQFQSMEDSRRNKEGVHDIPSFPILQRENAGIPLIIGGTKRSPKKEPQPRSNPFQAENPDAATSRFHHDSTILPSNTFQEHRRNRDQDLAQSPPSPRTIQTSLSHTNISQATSLTFMSNTFSANTSDSFARYLEGIHDDIVGDVGQEVELVAHAPMLTPQERDREYLEKLMPRAHRHMSSISARGVINSKISSEFRDTPPRHKGSRRRRKHGSHHIPSNSGKIQVDWSSAPPTETETDNKDGPCGSLTVSACGGMLPVASPLVGRKHRAESFTSPSYPLSLHSLDMDKMSLCGTENISQSGVSTGASYWNIFGENDSNFEAGALMDMSVSIGSRPSSAGSIVTRALGLKDVGPDSTLSPNSFGEHGSFMGVGGMMDLSVDSTTNSKANSQGSGGNSSVSGFNSSSGSSGKRNARSISPASIDKDACRNKNIEISNEQASNDQVITANEAALHGGQQLGWTWDGKCKE